MDHFIYGMGFDSIHSHYYYLINIIIINIVILLLLIIIILTPLYRSAGEPQETPVRLRNQGGGLAGDGGAA